MVFRLNKCKICTYGIYLTILTRYICLEEEALLVVTSKRIVVRSPEPHLHAEIKIIPLYNG